MPEINDTRLPGPTVVDVDPANIGTYCSGQLDDGRITIDVGDDVVLVGTKAALLDFGSTVVSMTISALAELAEVGT